MTLPTTARLPAGRHPGVAGKLATYTGAEGTYIDFDGILKTAAANVPRVEYSGVRDTLLSGGYSPLSVGTGSAPVVVSTTEEAPDGTLTAMRVQLNKGAGTTSNDSSTLSYTFRTNLGTIVGTPSAGSIWMRTTDGSTKLVRVDFNGLTSTTGDVSTVTVTPQWKRYNFGFTASLDTQRRMMVRLRGTTGTDDYADLLIWAPQQENFTLVPGGPHLPIASARASAWVGTARNILTEPSSTIGQPNSTSNCTSLTATGRRLPNGDIGSTRQFTVTGDTPAVSFHLRYGLTSSGTNTKQYGGAVWLRSLGAPVNIQVDVNDGTRRDYTITGTWQRVWARRDAMGISSFQFMDVRVNDGQTGASFEACFAQLADGPLTPWVEGGNVERDLLANPGTLLIEPETTNHVLGTSYSVSSSITLTTGHPDPSGGAGALKLVNNTAASTSRLIRWADFPMSAPGLARYCASVFVKAEGIRYGRLRIGKGAGFVASGFFDFLTGEYMPSAGHTIQSQRLANGWYRLSVSIVSNATASTTADMRLYLHNEFAQVSDANTEVLNAAIYVWGGQMEQGVELPSSFIPTTTVAVTRPADTATIHLP